MASSNIAKRRQLRALEARRDKFLEQNIKNRAGLATVRAELKLMRKK